MPVHNALTGNELHNPFHYNQSSDPGSVGASKWWFDTANNRIRVRNAGNTAWTDLADATTFASAARLVFSVSTEDGQRAVFDGQNLVSAPRIEIPVSVKGAVGDGVADDTAAIQSALDVSGSEHQECAVVLDKTGGIYRITDTLMMSTKGWLRGTGYGAQMPIIRTDTAMDITKHGIDIKDYGVAGSSRVRLEGFRIEDGRTSTSRTGRGISIDTVTNGEYLDRVFVHNFYDNIWVGSRYSSGQNDVLRISNCWSQLALNTCYKLNKIANNAMLDHNVAWAESSTSPVVAGFQISGNPGSTVISIISSKMEVQTSTVDMFQLGQCGTMTIMGATMRGRGPGRDVVRVTTGAGIGLTLMDINARNNTYYSEGTTASDPDGDIAVNLLNILDMGDGTAFTIPASERAIKFWSGGAWAGASAVKQGTMWMGRQKFSAGPGSPEGVVPANPGSIYCSDNGNVYRKGSGTGNTGWVAM